MTRGAPTAWDQLCLIRAAALLTDEEMDRFSPDTQDEATAPPRNAFGVFATTPCRGL
jgi:hypothetical protein